MDSVMGGMIALYIEINVEIVTFIFEDQISVLKSVSVGFFIVKMDDLVGNLANEF